MADHRSVFSLKRNLYSQLRICSPLCGKIQVKYGINIKFNYKPDSTKKMTAA